MKYSSNSLEETQKIAQDFISSIKPNNTGATVVGLYGDLGAGKTSFIQGISKALGVSDTVVSPTFVIMKVYELDSGFQRSDLKEDSKAQTLGKFTHLIHIDAYRIEKSSELLYLGWNDIISDPKNLIFIEWPERVADIMPEHIHIHFTHVSENSREIEIFG
ncbi:MAG TPA: tRNA (adenosine(37)-N6)-threonylcarbamoyltransferase complex ATPase subunit type 1 TsaE [Candidatus Paceibacterota bacterium]